MKTTGLPPTSINRRTFLRTAALCGSALAASSASSSESSSESSAETTNAIKVTELENSPATDYLFLSEADIPFVRSVFLAVAEPAMSESAGGRKRAMTSALLEFDDHCQHLSPMMQTTLRKLMTVANMPLVRGITTGVWEEWWQVDRIEARQFMDRWQNSRLFPLRMSHAALVQLAAMAWSGTTEAVADIGFPGTPHARLLVTQPNNY